jgi:hypothetical protein
MKRRRRSRLMEDGGRSVMVVRNERKIIRQGGLTRRKSGRKQRSSSLQWPEPHHVRPRRSSHAEMLAALAAIGAKGCSRWLEMG